MITMQYRIGLPADYDMDIIRRRIAERGHLTDAFPELAFKAYLYADRQSAYAARGENLYAPFYLWHSTEGMNDFLSKPVHLDELIRMMENWGQTINGARELAAS